MPRRTFIFRTVASVILGVILMVPGCNRGAQNLPLDRTVARESLVQFLSAWKAEQHPRDLKQDNPAIIVGEANWEAGWKLVHYRLLDTAADDGTNLHATVELVLRPPGRRDVRSTRTYIIGTSPVITIFPK